jgi:hypothetical protein
MRYLQALSLVVLLAFAASCDSSDNTPTGTGANGSGLTILSLGKDSLYWRETSWIVLNQKRDSVGTLNLFVGSHRMMIDSCVGNKLYFRSQTGAESGPFRLYENDIQAKGDVRVTFLAHDIEFAAFVNFGGLRDCYVGETLFFEIREMPWRDGDYEFLLGDTPLKLKGERPKGSVGYLFFAVPEGATDGMLKARVFDDTIEFAHVSILKHPEPFLAQHHLRALEIRFSNLLGPMLARDPDTLRASDRISLTMQYAFDDLDELTLDGDTLRLQQLKTNGGSFKLDLAITENKHGLLSGRVEIVSRYDGLFGTEQQLSLTFKDLPWREYGGRYECLASGPQVSEQLVSMSYKNIYDGVAIEETRYEGGDRGSAFAIMIDR